MPRGGFREGAGRKKEYTEPVRKILLGLPESVLQELDQYADQRDLSRPKAIAALLKQINRPEEPARQKTQNKVVLQELKLLREKLKKSPDWVELTPLHHQQNFSATVGVAGEMLQNVFSRYGVQWYPK